MAAPDFALPDLTNQIRTLATFQGKPVLLNFWVAGSASCQEDLKLFNRLHARWAAQGLQLLTVNVDGSTDAEKVRAFARDSHLSFPILQGSDDLAGIYNILYRYLFDRHRDLSLPTSFLINAGGEIVKVYQGPVNPEHVEQDFQHIPQTAAERLAKALPFPGVIDTLDFSATISTTVRFIFSEDIWSKPRRHFGRPCATTHRVPRHSMGWEAFI